MTNNKVHKFIDLLSNKYYFGKLTLSYEAGNIVHVRKMEDFKPNNLPINEKNDIRGK